MAIELLTSGKNFKDDYKAKINEIVIYLNQLEKCKINPSVGKTHFPAMIDLSQFLTIDDARQAGLQI